MARVDSSRPDVTPRSLLTFRLRRVAYRGDGVAGVLLIEETPRSLLPLCVTLEPSWELNVVRVSCIPAGTYLCRKVKSPKFGWTFEVTGVLGRTLILFHNGTVEGHTQGCILLGFGFGAIDGLLDIRDSRTAFAALMTMTSLRGIDEFHLIVEDFEPGRTTLVKH